VRLKVPALDNKWIGLTVSGVVRGNVTVLTGEGDTDKDRISLGAFPRESGVTRTVTVEAKAGEDVVLESKPEFMHAELKPGEQGSDGRKRWSLIVSIAANAVGAGPFGRPGDALSDTAIYLKANGRMVRIPVTGAASQR
jgi:hypothetical protein